MNRLPSNTEADVRELRAWVERYCATVTAGDFDAYRAFWTDDVVWLPPDAPERKGIAACMEYNRPLFEYYNSVETMSGEEIKVIGDMPWSVVTTNSVLSKRPCWSSMERILPMRLSVSIIAWKMASPCGP